MIRTITSRVTNRVTRQVTSRAVESGIDPNNDLRSTGRERSNDTNGNRTGLAAAMVQLLRSRQFISALTTVLLNLALAGFVSVSCLSLLRAFVDAKLQTPILIGLGAGLAVPAASRLLRVPSWLALVASAVTEFVVLGVWFSEKTSTTFQSHTFVDARESMINALQQINRIVAPSPSLVGFGITVSLVAWLVGVTADLMCFGIPSPIGALLTPSAVFIASASLTSRKDHRHQSTWLLGILVALAIYLIAVGIKEQSRRSRWFANKPGSLMQTALALGLAFTVIGVAANRVAVRLAFDKQQPAVDFRVGNQIDNERVIASPLVSLQRRLLRQSNNEQFSVSSRTRDGLDVPSYWRLTALDEFTGESWQSTGEYRSVGTSGRLTASRSAADTDVRQQFVIAELGTESLPAAYAPVQYEGNVQGVAFASDTSTILAKASLKPKTTYVITSVTPKNLDPTNLSSYDSIVTDRDQNVILPRTFPARVRELAIEITKDQPTTIQKALALQNFFRTEFVYSLDVPAGSSEPALERFLFTDRTGYCEQFAGAFAAMARSIDLPARVAVGFTPGRFDPSDRRFHVTGKNSHAWPEIRLGDGSWFPFEPTPGRGFPGLQDTTGVAPQDLSESAQPIATPTTALSQSSTTIAATSKPSATEATSKKQSRHGLYWFGAALFVALLSAGFFLILWRRKRSLVSDGTAVTRKSRAPSILRVPARRVDKAWSMTERRLGQATQVHETEETVAQRLEHTHPELPELASLAQRARYADASPAQVDDNDASRAEELAASIAGRTTK